MRFLCFLILEVVICEKQETNLHEKLLENGYNKKIIQNKWRRENRKDFKDLGDFVDQKCDVYETEKVDFGSPGSMKGIGFKIIILNDFSVYSGQEKFTGDKYRSAFENRDFHDKSMGVKSN